VNLKNETGLSRFFPNPTDVKTSCDGAAPKRAPNGNDQMNSQRRTFLAGAVAAVAAPGLSLASNATPSSGVQAARDPLLIRGGTILSMDPTVGDIAGGDILVRDGKIARIGKAIDAPGAQILDAAGRIVIPGFVDTHRHAWEGQLRRINPNSADLADYIAGTHASFATAYRPKDMYIGNLLTSLGALDAGITTIVDNSHNSRSFQHALAAVDALHDAGIRAVHAPGAPLAGDWAGVSRYQDLATLQAERFADREGLVTLAMMVSLDREEWAVGRRLGLPLVTEFFGREMSAQLPAMREAGLLGPDNIFNHCTDLSDQAWRILRETGVKVNVCARSDAQWALADGMFGFQAAISHGIRPGLSIDNESAYGGDMFAEMRAALYLQRSAAQGRRFVADRTAPAPVSLRQLLSAATVDGAVVAQLGRTTGSLTEGKAADIVLINTDAINVYPSNNALGTVVSAADRSNVETVIVGGRIRKQGGKLVDVDFDRVRAMTEESRRYLFEAVGFDGNPLAERFSLS
jgi:cytosine/adenosine deaminase-related metal-dependent hydrolase